MASNFYFKGADGLKYDISDVFDTTATSSLPAANNTPFKKKGSTTNILNNFRLHSTAGGGHPLQSRPINFKINSSGIDLSKYYMPKYYSIIPSNTSNLQVANPTSSITIPGWASQIGLVIQATGGSTGKDLQYYTNSETRTAEWCDPNVDNNKTYKSTYTKNTGIPPTYYQFKRKYSTTSPTPPGVSGKTLISTATAYLKNQNFTAESPMTGKNNTISTISSAVTTTKYTYTYANGPYTVYGGTGAGGNCYCGVYSIPTTNRPNTMTYNPYESGVSKVTFNDTTNSSAYSAVTVFNGAAGGNATSGIIYGNGAAGVNSNVVGLNNDSKFSGSTAVVTTSRGSYKGTSSGSPFSLNKTAINTAMGFPPDFNFTSSSTGKNYGNPGPSSETYGNAGIFVYFFLL
jgi:hypothetical protein